MPFLPPGEYLRGLYVDCKRGILGGAGKRKVVVGGMGERIHHRLWLKGFDLNEVELYF